IDGLLRMRFITSHPRFFMNDFWTRIKDLSKVCRYVHVPAQHGSNRILKAMKRLYTREEFLEMALAARDAIPDMALASDFIVGFPTETEEDYLQCETILREVNFANSFVFKYSPRPETPAHGMIDDVLQADKNRRCTQLLKVQEEISLKNNQSTLGKSVEVLVDGPSKTNDQMLSGRSDDNRIVIFKGKRSLVGELVEVTIDNVTPFSLYGSISTSPDVSNKPMIPRSLPIIS
ncbi:MAG: radical SAM protein, partial [Planctomycetota bacterium]|nr:radical SAM protein [Planctomycetota bacterium]